MKVKSRRVSRPLALMLAAAAVVCGPAALARQAALPPAPPAAVVAAAPQGQQAWAEQLWKAASAGREDEVTRLLQNPAGGGADFRAAVTALEANVASRETRRAEQAKKIEEELARMVGLAGDEKFGDLALSGALRSAVALQMISADKKAFLERAEITDIVARAEEAARAAEGRGDWLMASELYYRLNLLVEEHGRKSYKADVARERRRLEMIRLYAPERFWEIRNARRNAEIEFNKASKALAEATTAAEGNAADDNKPLPPYNPTGDDFREKLRGIDAELVLKALRGSFLRHVEQTPMEKIMREALGAVRTLAATPDMRKVFPTLADDEARGRFLAALDAEEQRVERLRERATEGDLSRMVQVIADANERTVKLPEYAIMHELGNGGMDALDEFSAIIWPDEMRRFQRNTQGQFYGVGIQIEQDPLQNIRVVTPIEGTPAFRAGVQRGDIILKVNGASTVGFTIDQAVDNITGPLGTKVTLTLKRETTDEQGKQSTEELEFPLVRDVIPIYSVKGWRRSGDKETDWDWMIDRDRKIGYVRLSQFAERTLRDLDNAIDEMKAQGVRGVILDLRFNPGGLLEGSVEVASRFIDAAKPNEFKGLIVSTHKKNDETQTTETARRGKARLSGLPTVVLINEGSASASEIVSGAIQDYARGGSVKAIVLGQRSFGKGSVQNVWPLNTAQVQAAVKVTTNYYHLPGGRMIHRRPNAAMWGVQPNLGVEMLPEQIVEMLRQRNNADVRRGTVPSPENPAEKIKAEDRALDTANPMAGPDLQVQYALLLLRSQLPTDEAAQAMRVEGGAGKP